MSQPDVEIIFRHEMLKLRVEYLTNSLRTTQTMHEVLCEQRPPRIPLEAVNQLIRLAHRLRGSGRLYDLPEVTDWATVLEEDLKAVKERRGRVTLERLRSLRSVVEKLSSIFEAEQEATGAIPTCQ
jgi:chemotaxis protein histidine kinase CheA